MDRIKILWRFCSTEKVLTKLSAAYTVLLKLVFNNQIEAKNHIIKISGYINEISKICKVHEVDKLSIFGSFLTADFDNSSDVDFLVIFSNKIIKGSFDRYFSLKEDLELLFKLPVDLVCEDKIRNPYFKSSVDQTRRVLYAA